MWKMMRSFVMLSVVTIPVLSFSTQPAGSCTSGTDATNAKVLFPYQETGVKRLVSTPRALLADEMGLGKTVQAISALNQLCQTGAFYPRLPSVLIICPKSVLNVWVDELEEWLDPRFELEVKVIVAGTGTKKKGAPLETGEDRSGIVQLINYDICHIHRQSLQEGEFDVVICDEAHYLKSPDTKRTRAVLGGGGGGGGGGGSSFDNNNSANNGGIRSKYFWFLTGTPIMNRPIELYPLLRSIDPEAWESMDAFMNRYCDPKMGRWGEMEAKGASNLGELSDRLQPYMIRRYKADVLSDLPPKLRSCVPLDGSEAATRERKMIAEMIGTIDYNDNSNDNENHTNRSDTTNNRRKNGLASFGAGSLALKDYLPNVKTSDLQDERFLGALAKIRRETAMLKLRPAIQLLKDVIQSHKVVVFAHHRQLILDLADEFGDVTAVRIIGGDSSESRAEAVRRFQNDDSCRLFIGSIRAAGVGVTLTASSHVVFLELDWSPAIMAQAEDRCHRVGQTDSVQVQYYVFRDTVDEWIARQLILKQMGISMALPPTEEEPEASTQGRQQEKENTPTSSGRHYVLDFGKHKGLRIEDVPQNYLRFIIETDDGAIWRSPNRRELWRALFRYGLVSDEPPPPPQLTPTREKNGKRPTSQNISFEVILALRGTEFYVTDYCESLKFGMPLILVRQPENEFDSNAIRVCRYPNTDGQRNNNNNKNDTNKNKIPTAQQTIGHVSREQASLLAPHIDAGSIKFTSAILAGRSGPTYTLKAKGLARPSKEILTLLKDQLSCTIDDVGGSLSKASSRLDGPVESFSIKDTDEPDANNNDNDNNNNNANQEVEYTFDFGKHRGEKWDDVPMNYKAWIIRNDVWNTRPRLKKALVEAGLIE